MASSPASSSVDDFLIDPEYIQFLLDPALEFSCYFVVGNAELAPVEKIGVVRKMLAAHSEVFRSQLLSRQWKSEEPEEIKDILPAIFKNLLRFVYGFDRTTKMSFGDADDLLYVADRYIMKRLKDKLATRLMCLLDYTNICSLLTNPACARALELQREMTRILQSETDKVLSTPQFLSCCPDTFVKILEQEVLNIPELEVWRAALKWAKNKAKSEDSKSLRQQLEKPLQHIRICTLPLDEFCKEVASTGVLTNEEVGAVCVALTNGEKPLALESISNKTETRNKPDPDVVTKDGVRYVKGAEAYADIDTGSGWYGSAVSQCFTLETKSVEVEITKVLCFVHDDQQEQCKVMVKIEPLTEESTPFDTTTVTHTVRPRLFVTIPMSTEEKKVLLPPNRRYRVTVTSELPLYVFKRKAPVYSDLEHLTLTFRKFQFGEFGSPVSHVYFRPLLPWSPSEKGE